MNDIVTITLLRSGSKRLPNKNIMQYKDKTLYQHTEDHAKQLGYPYYIFTDYPDLKLNYGKVYPKPLEYAQDNHLTGEEIKRYLNEHKIDCKFIILLQATSPERNIDKIKQWIRLFQFGYYDVGFSAKKIKNRFYYDKSGNPLNYRFQDRDYNSGGKKEVYVENGSFYIFKKEQLSKQHFIDSWNHILFEDDIDINIDRIEDVKHA